MLVVAYVVAAIVKVSQRKHRFKEFSTRWEKFFTKWYSKTGQLTLYSNDLEWLEKPESSKVLNAIKLKGNRVIIYLKKFDSSIVRDLLQCKVSIYQIADSAETDHRFSIREDDGITRVIVRNKEVEEDKIVFIETDNYRDPYLVSLIKDLLKLSNVQVLER